MALPANVSLVTVHGRVHQAIDGSPATGSITFTIPLTLRDYPAITMLVPDSLTANLDTNGEFTVVLPATDDPDVDPVGWVYTVTEGWAGGRSEMQFALPAAPNYVEWIFVEPTEQDSPIYIGPGMGSTGPEGPAGPTGPAGPAGPTGPAGADGSGGGGVNARGEWAPATAYEAGDTAYTDDGMWVANFFAYDNEPSDPTSRYFVCGCDSTTGNAADVALGAGQLEGIGTRFTAANDGAIDRVALFFDPSGAAPSGTLTVTLRDDNSTGDVFAVGTVAAADITRSDSRVPTYVLLDRRTVLVAGSPYTLTVRGTGAGSARTMSGTIGVSALTPTHRYHDAVLNDIEAWISTSLSTPAGALEFELWDGIWSLVAPAAEGGGGGGGLVVPPWPLVVARLTAAISWTGACNVDPFYETASGFTLGSTTPAATSPTIIAIDGPHPSGEFSVLTDIGTPAGQYTYVIQQTGLYQARVRLRDTGSGQPDGAVCMAGMVITDLGGGSNQDVIATLNGHDTKTGTRFPEGQASAMFIVAQEDLDSFGGYAFVKLWFAVSTATAGSASFYTEVAKFGG